MKMNKQEAKELMKMLWQDVNRTARVLFAAGMCALAAGSMTACESTGGAKAGAHGDSHSGAAGKMAARLEAIRPALVRVEYTFKHDKGDSPMSSLTGRQFGESISLERPHEEAGFLVSPTTVVSTDLMVHPRFVESIRVRFGEAQQNGTIEHRDATVVSFSRNENACMIELDTPFEHASPAQFVGDVDDDDSLYLIGQGYHNAVWTRRASRLGRSYLELGNGETITAVSGDGIVVNEDGQAVGMTMNHELPVGDEWLGDPVTTWEWASANELDADLDTMATQWARGIGRVALRFRSPKKSMYGDDSEEMTEWNGVGLVLANGHVLIPLDLKPKVTARLELISVFLMNEDGSDEIEHTATFNGSLEDYGAFVATFDEPVSAEYVLDLADSPDVFEYRTTMLFAREVLIQGESRVNYDLHGRFDDFDRAWKGRIYPQGGYTEGEMFFFDSTTGELLTFPLAQREKAGSDSGYNRYSGYYYGNETANLPTAYISGLFADLASAYDSNNIPLDESEENRLAWLGVELQSIDTELARAMEIADETDDGRFGGLVSHLYADSPAEEHGLQPGDLLLRLHFEEIPKPIEITADESMWSAYGGFPWDQLGELPPEYFSEIPTPWGSVENSLNRTLTDIGFGTPFTLDLIRDGETMSLDFNVEEGPSNYDSAARFENEMMGMTVRNLTYEVRRYFRKTTDDPGVIVSKIEPGLSIAVAGMKPFEIITAVNDVPVHNVEEFEKALEGATEARFSVLRMMQGRVVKVRLGE